MILIKKKYILLSGGHDCKIKLWNSATLSYISYIDTGTIVYLIAQSNSDDNIIIISSVDKIIRIYDLSNIKLINQIQTYHTDYIWRLLILENSNEITILSGSNDNKIMVWNNLQKNYRMNFKFILTLQQHGNRIESIILLKYDYKTIVSADRSGNIIIWSNMYDIKRKKEYQMFQLVTYFPSFIKVDAIVNLKESIKEKVLIWTTNLSTIIFCSLINYEILRKIKLEEIGLDNVAILDDEDGMVITLHHTDLVIWR